MAERFTLSTDPVGSGQRWWMHVAIHDTTADLRRAAKRRSPSDEPTFWDNCGGCFHPHISTTRYLGMMRLCYEHLTPDVVIHESVHAAVTYTWKSLSLQRIHLNPYSQASMDGREEVLAHAVNGISTALLRELGLLA